MDKNEILMKECLRLASKGKGFVSPNPLVGCVILKDGKILGKGYHKKFGEAHAEANAISDLKKQGYSAKGAVVYVNLEPCSHTGKTLPCADLLIKEKVKEVFIGMKDPFNKVNGKGIRKLTQAGIKVNTGILEDECKSLNKFFIKFVTKQRPYVSLKIAQSIDSKIALKNFKSKWITGSKSRKFVHQLRSEYDAVLIGRNTAQYDNPSLNARDVKGRTPLRIVLDRDETLSSGLNIFTDADRENTIVLSSKRPGSNSLKNIINLKSNKDRFELSTILKKLYELNISSVLVEGGGNLFSQFVSKGIFDEIFIFTAPVIIGNGIQAFSGFEFSKLSDAVKLETVYIKKSGKDILINYKKCSQE